MCLAIPSKVVGIECGMATIDVDGVKRSVSLMLLEDVKLGNYVIVHAGFAIKILDEKFAVESLMLLKKALFHTENH